MPDNYPHEFDEQFVDHAWADMKALLDREMPVSRERRAAGWWHWVLLGLALLFFLAAGINHWSSSTDANEQKKAPAATAQTRQLPPGQKEEESTLESRTETAGTGHPLLNTARKPAQANSSPPIASRRRKEQLIDPPAQPAGPILQKKSLLAPAPLTGSTLPENASDRTEPAKATDIPKEGFRPRAKLTALPPLPTTGPSELDGSGTSETLPSPEATLPRLIRLAAETGVFSSGAALAEGVSLGISGTLYFRHSPWHLRAALLYRYYAQNLRNSEKVHSLQNSAFLVPQQGQFVPRTSLLFSNSEITASHNFSMPLLAGFQIWSKLDVEAGLEASILFAARESASWSLSGESSSPSGPTAEREPIYRSESKAPSQALNSANLSLLGGVRYQATSRIGLQLSYQYGLTNLLASPEFEAYQRGIWLNVAYRLMQ